MKTIEGKNFPEERALYAAQDLCLKNCSFDGEEDGESALKESKNVRLEGCRMNLRYPLWHDSGVEIVRSVMTDKCRAALWYTDHVSVRDSVLHGVKALRECSDIDIVSSDIVSAEFGWHSHRIRLEGGTAESEYLFLMASDIRMKDVTFKGKYSFQYVENAEIEHCVLDTKDAFWHAKNVTVHDCVIKGEYLAWYSENLTLERCRITGTQPLCYCKNLRLIDCEMVDADLSFEYSDVDAAVMGEILSVKNPRSGRIAAGRIRELIYTEDSVYPCRCEIVQTDRQ